MRWPWKKHDPRHVVFHVTTGDGNKHEVAAASWVQWVALRSLERKALPLQEDMRYMLRHMDDGSTDGLIADLLQSTIPKVRRAAVKGGIDLVKEG